MNKVKDGLFGDSKKRLDSAKKPRKYRGRMHIALTCEKALAGLLAVNPGAKKSYKNK